MSTNEEITALFPVMMERFRPEKAEGVDATIQFELSGDSGGTYWVKIADKACEYGEGDVAEPDMVFKAADEDFKSLIEGNMNPVQAFMMGKIKVNNMDLGMKMVNIFQMT